MELKNLFSKFTPVEEKKEYFLALEISPRYVWAAVWETKGKVEIVSLGSKERWDGQTLKSLTVASDASLASALTSLPEEPNRVVFGLPETWVSKNKIVPPRLADLKALCQKLDLKPLGFVVTTSALIQYLKILESNPISAILIHVGEEEITLTLVELGRNLGTQVIGRSEDFGADVYEGIARFGKEKLFPSRILLYDTDLDELKQSLLSYEWEESLFLHFPKVEILDNKVSIKAVTITGGGEAVDSLGLIKEISAKDFGFQEGIDVMKKEIEEETKEPVIEKPEKMTKKFTLPKLRLPKIKIRIPRFQLPRFSLKGRFPLVIATVAFFLFLLGGGVMAFYWYYPKAKVKIFVESKSLEKEIEISVDPNLTLPDFDKKQIPGETVEVKVKESKEKETSGEKLVGERAKGEVTVYNFTSSSKIFDKGATIIGPNNLEFILDIDIVVASASSTLDENWNEVVSPGKTKVAVTASKIGPESNLASESEFNLKGYSFSSYRAKNEKAFSGGTSRQVKVVSGEDQEELTAELTAELNEKVKEELAKRTPEGKKILEEGILTSLISREFDGAVGAEAERLKLDLTMKAKTLAYSPVDLENLLERVIAGSIPSGFVKKKIETKISAGKVEEGKTFLNVHLKVSLVPDLDLKEIKGNLLGKYPEVAKEYLHSLPNFVEADVTITPNLPPRLRVFPRSAKNIDIQIELKE